MKGIWKDWLMCGGAMLPALAVQTTWLWTNTALPVADATGPLLSSAAIYKEFVTIHWMNGLHSLYWVRDYRPTGFYLLEVPFQFPFSGDAMLTASGVTLLCTGMTCVYLYWLLRLALKPSLALTGALFLGLLPAVQWPSTFFAFSDIALMPAVLASIYHLLRSRSFSNPLHTTAFAVALAVALIIRPIEGLTHLVLVLVIFLCLAAYRREVSLLHLYWVIAGALISGSILIAAGVLNGLTLHSTIFTDGNDPGRGALFKKASFYFALATAVVLAALPLWMGAKRLGQLRWPRSPYIVPAFILSYVLVVLFYLGWVPRLVDWLYATSFGNLIVSAGKPPAIPERLIMYLQLGPTLPFLAIILLGGVSFFVCATSETRRLVRGQLLYVAAVVPVTLALLLFTAEWYWRHVLIAITAIYIVGVAAALLPGKWLKLRVGVIAGFAAIVGIDTLMVSIGGSAILLSRPFTLGNVKPASAFPEMNTQRPNPVIVGANFIEQYSKMYGIKVVAVPMSMSGDFDAFALSLMMSGNPNVTLYLIYRESAMSLAGDDLRNAMRGWLEGKADGLFLMNDVAGDFAHGPTEVSRLQDLEAQRSAVNDRINYSLLTMEAEDSLSAIGFEKKTCVTFAGSHRQACLYARAKGSGVTSAAGSPAGSSSEGRSGVVPASAMAPPSNAPSE